MCWIAAKKAESVVGTVYYERPILLHLYQVPVFSQYSNVLEFSLKVMTMYLSSLCLFYVYRRRLESTQKVLEPIPVIGLLTGMI